MKEQLAHRLAGGELGGRGLGTQNYFLAQAQIAIDFFCEEMEKVEPNVSGNKEDVDIYLDGWYACRQKILSLLEE